MPEAQETKSSTPASTPPATVLRLAAFHRSEDVQEHLAPLRQVRGVEILQVWQGATWTLPRGVAGILWELAPQDGADSRIGGLIEGVPACSYSLASNPALLDVSRKLGFRRHLSTPVRLVEVERALNLPAVIDLADRLDAATPRLVRLSRRTEALSELMRAVNASSDPTALANTLVSRLADWLPLTEWSVMAIELDGTVRRLDDRDLDPVLQTRGRRDRRRRPSRRQGGDSFDDVCQRAHGGRLGARPAVGAHGARLAARRGRGGRRRARSASTMDACADCPRCRPSSSTRWVCSSSRRPSR